MTRKDEYATSVHLTDETFKLLEDAIKYLKKQEDEEKDPREREYRLANMKFDRDKVIRKALKEFNQSTHP